MIRPAFLAGASTGLLVAVAVLIALDPLLPPPLWVCGSRQGGDVLRKPWVAPAPPTFKIDMNALPPRDPAMPRGGSYGHPGDVGNLSSGMDTVLRVTRFDAACDAVVIDGQPIDARHLPAGWTQADSDGTAVFQAGDGAIVLRGVPLALWAKGADHQTHGTAGNDTLTGTPGAESLIPGSGDDLIIPSGGDDRIGFTSGNKVISDVPPNTGRDTLDLRRFTAGSLGVTLDGTDLVIQTPDGSLRLQGQRDAGNIEIVLLSDDQSLTAADLVALAAR